MMPIITQPLIQPDRQPSQSTRGQSEDLDETQVPPPSSQLSDRRAQVKTPEPRIQSIQHAGHNRASGMDDQRSPGHIPDFDWDAFESRYERALSESNEQEKELLEEFDRLVKVSHFQIVFCHQIPSSDEYCSTSTFGNLLPLLMTTSGR